MDGAISAQMGQGYTRQVTEQVRRSKSVGSAPPQSLLHFLPSDSCLSYCTDFYQNGLGPEGQIICPCLLLVSVLSQ